MEYVTNFLHTVQVVDMASFIYIMQWLHVMTGKNVEKFVNYGHIYILHCCFVAVFLLTIFYQHCKTNLRMHQFPAIFGGTLVGIIQISGCCSLYYLSVPFKAN